MITLSMNSDLDCILDSGKVRELTGTMLRNLNKVISERISILESEISSGALNSKYTVNGKSIFYESSKPIKDSYETVLEGIKKLVNDVDDAAMQTEEEELIRLKNLLEKKKERLAEERSGEAIAISKNQTYKPKYDWTPILVPHFTEMLAETEDKISKVNKRLNKIGEWKTYDDAVAAGCSNILTKEEFARRKSGKNSGYDKYKTYDDYIKAMSKKYKGSYSSGTYYERLHVTKKNEKLANEINDSKTKWTQKTGQSMVDGSQNNCNRYYSYTTKDGRKVDITTNDYDVPLYYHTVTDTGYDVYYDKDGNPIPNSTRKLLTTAGNYMHNSSNQHVWTPSPDQSGMKNGATKYIYTTDNNSKVYAVSVNETPVYYEVKQADGSTVYYNRLFSRISKKDAEYEMSIMVSNDNQ